MNATAARLGLTPDRTFDLDEVSSVTEPLASNYLESARFLLSDQEDEPLSMFVTEDDVWAVVGSTRAVVFEDGTARIRRLPESETATEDADEPEESDSLSPLDEDAGDVPLYFNPYTVVRKGSKQQFVSPRTSRELEALAETVVGKLARKFQTQFRSAMMKAIKAHSQLPDLLKQDGFTIGESATSLREAQDTYHFGPVFTMDGFVEPAKGQGSGALSGATATALDNALRRIEVKYERSDERRRLRKEVTARLKKDKRLMQMLQSDGLELNESATETDMTLTDIDSAEIQLGENTLALVGNDGEDAIIEFDLTNDHPSYLRSAFVALDEQASELGFEPFLEFDEDLEEESDDYQDALAEATADTLDEIASYLADHLGAIAHKGIMGDVQAFDAAVDEGDFDGALRRAELLAAEIDDDVLEAVKRMSRGAILARSRNAKKQTPEERQRNRKAARYRKTSAYKTARKRYAKKYRSRPGRRESVEDGGEQMLFDENFSDETFKASVKGKSATDDSLRKAAAKHFKNTAGSYSTFGSLKTQGATYVGESATDAQMLKVLGQLVNEGLVEYAAGKGYIATDALVEMDDESDDE